MMTVITVDGALRVIYSIRLQATYSCFLLQPLVLFAPDTCFGPYDCGGTSQPVDALGRPVSCLCESEISYSTQVLGYTSSGDSNVLTALIRDTKSLSGDGL